MINQEAVDKTITHLEQLPPERFDMSTFGSMGNCGTVGCLAFHIVEANSTELSYAHAANKALEILNTEDESLFYLDMWPIGLKNAYTRAYRSGDFTGAKSVAITAFKRWAANGGHW